MFTLLVLLLPRLFDLVHTAPINETLVPPVSIDPYPSSKSDHCERTGQWQAYAFLVEDCYAAIQQLYIHDVLKYPDETFEFTARASTSRTGHPLVRTPAFYEINSCTLAVVTLDWFKNGALPGGSFHHGSYETATFTAVWKAARKVEDQCLLAGRKPGWQPFGAHGNVGVFLWATDSEINRQITGLAARGGTAPNLDLANASFVGLDQY